MLLILFIYVMNKLFRRDQNANNNNLPFPFNIWPLNYLRLDFFAGLYAMFEEWFNLIRRVDKGFCDSMIYKHNDINCDGKVALITGGDKDIGAVTASYLSKLGFRVIIGVKDIQNEKIDTKSGIKGLKLDLSSLESVRDFAKEVTKLEPKIDLLINSAEVFDTNKVLTKEMVEKNFAENYLGHFLLTTLLINNLKSAENGRVVNVSSFAHYFGSINLDDLNNTFYLPFLPLKAYCQSKLAQVLFTRELSKRLIDTNVTVYAVSPEILRANQWSLSRNSVLSAVLTNLTNPVNGSQTLLYVSLEDSLKNESGFYYTNLKKVHPLMSNATNDTVAEKLWKLSENLVKLEDGLKIPQNISQINDSNVEKKR